MHFRCKHPTTSVSASPHSNQNAQRRIPTLYVPLRFFWLSGSRLGGWSLLQTITNGFRGFAERQNVADDYKRFQTVAKHRICKFHRPAPLPPFPYQLRERMQATFGEDSPQSGRKKDPVHLRSLPSAQPATSTGQVVAVWKEIEAGLARGMKLREVWEAAKLDGLEIPYPQFRVYVSRLRRRRQRPPQSLLGQPPPQTSAENASPAPPSSDPFRNLREQREKARLSRFEYDPTIIKENLF